MTTITPKQNDLLAYLVTTMAANEVAPSLDEMAAYLGLRSKSAAHRLLAALEDAGFIKREPLKARAIEILRVPRSMENIACCPHCGGHLIAPASIPRTAAVAQPAHLNPAN